MKDAIRERWPEVRALFEAALAQPRAARDGWLAAQPADDALREAVAALLADADDETLGGIEGPGAGELADGQHIGRYRILRTLGRGGMGVVYLAEQSNPRRLVALKLLAGAVGDAALARFRREAELLARLSHPGIARIVEVDADAGGRPFLVMEYVEGRDLAAHCVDRSRDERLALLARVADAVEHAHQRGVVHRDLKPSNILVDADGQPRVLDFGIGQVVGEGETLTATGTLLGTPAYMSPEQAAGSGKVDARSDVYALGVLAYELVADRLPLPVAGLTPLEALRVVGESTPPPLSRIDRTLRGDLEVIVETALAKSPSLRYASAGALADDLRRYLAREPIRARRPSAWRRGVLYARRKPAQVATLALALFGVLGGSALAVGYAVDAARERDRARAALADARDTQAALARVFAAGNPTLVGKPDVAFRDVLAATPAQIADLPPAIRLTVQYTVAQARAQIGDALAAIDAFVAAVRIAEELGEPRARAQAEIRRIMVAYDHVDLAESERAIAAVLADPAVQADPILHVAALLVGTGIAAGTARVETAVRRFQAARARWPDLAGRTPPIDDAGFLAEIEVNALVIEMAVMAYGLPGARPADAYVAAVRDAQARLARVFAPDEPHYAMLGVIAEYLPDAIAGEATWRQRLIASVDAQVPRLGSGHPTIVARLRVAQDMAGMKQMFDVALSRRLLEAMRHADGSPRARLRETTLLGGGGMLSALGLTRADVVAMRDAVCGARSGSDLDCIAADLLITEADIADGRVDAALARLEVLLDEGAALPPSIAQMIFAQVGYLYRGLGRDADAIAAAERAVAAVQANDEVPQQSRDIILMQMSWSFRPTRCDRVLDLIGPIEARLASYPAIGADTLARLLATCEVRVGRDPAAALARLAPWWEKARAPGVDPMFRLEMINGHLEIFHVLGRDAEFAQWARELVALEAAGVEAGHTPAYRAPWMVRARELVGQRGTGSAAD
jgi:predicted Ser/Thr protein kinase